MGAPQEIDDLSKSELRATVLSLLSKVMELEQIVRAQSDETARLKDLNQRPKIKPNEPSGMEQATSAPSTLGGKGLRVTILRRRAPGAERLGSPVCVRSLRSLSPPENDNILNGLEDVRIS
jgi:hypothetical protein